MALIKCRECGEAISSKAKACPRCGYSPGGKARPTKKVGCCGLIAIGAFGLFVVALITTASKPGGLKRGDGDAPRPSVNQAQQQKAAPAGDTPHVGDVISLDDGDSMCVLAADDASWDEMLDIQNAGGDMMPLIRADRVVPAPKGSRAKVVNAGFASYRVQLLDGPHQGKTGWIQREFVKK